MPAAKLETAPPTAADRAVKIEVEKVVVKAIEPVQRDRYWIGVVNHSPYDRVDVAGITFHKMTDPPRQNGDEQYREVSRGCIVSLSDDEVDRVKKKVVTKWIQGARERNGRLFGGFIRSADYVGFIPGEGDIPLAKYLYMRRLAAGENPSRAMSVTCPETMA